MIQASTTTSKQYYLERITDIALNPRVLDIYVIGTVEGSGTVLVKQNIIDKSNSRRQIGTAVASKKIPWEE